MPNNADLGITLQKLICEKYQLIVPLKASEQFNANYNPNYTNELTKLIQKLFAEVNLTPIECLTYTPSPNKGERLSPHNFILSNGKTLSIRTNKNGDKVAPRVVGQCGIPAFNYHFSELSGRYIEDKQEIKEIVYEQIHKMLPLFIDYMFISDYTVWVREGIDSSYEYTIYDKSKFVDIALDRNNFTFTRNLDTWTESTTLKYKSKSLAEIQIHTNRTFKFRFMMATLTSLLKEQQDTIDIISLGTEAIIGNLFNLKTSAKAEAKTKLYTELPELVYSPVTLTNETLGISAEAAVCYAFGIDIPDNYDGRVFNDYVKNLWPVVQKAFSELPPVIQSTGATKGERGKNSKCSYDFILAGNKTLSLKSNTGNMVCPPEVGQPGAETCYLYFKEFIDGNEITPDIFKQMVYRHIEKLIPIYINHLFDSDYLLWIYKKSNSFNYKIFSKNYAADKVWLKEKFTFTKPTLMDWNESNTVKYEGITIGEFQVHSKRNCYKFRFNLENLSRMFN